MSKEELKFTDLPEDKQDKIKQEYLEGSSVSSLAAKYGVPRTSISYHANKKWKKELELARAELFSHFSSSKKANFIKMSESAMKVMARSLEELADRPMPPTIREAKDAAVIMESLDKITRLDDGNPTDIIAEKPISIKEIKQKLALDPFYEEDIDEADFKEIEVTSSESDS